MKKRGVSGVVTVVILIALVLAATVMVWAVVQNLVDDELSGAESCFGNFGEITINNGYTCYNSSSKEFQFGVDIGNIAIKGLLVSISGEGKKKSFKILEAGLDEPYLKPYGTGKSYADIIYFPEENSGETYVVDMNHYGFDPSGIAIAPIINDEQCEESDSLFQIDDCALLV
jgi:flagellin-like protein